MAGGSLKPSTTKQPPPSSSSSSRKSRWQSNPTTTNTTTTNPPSSSTTAPKPSPSSGPTPATPNPNPNPNPKRPRSSDPSTAGPRPLGPPFSPPPQLSYGIHMLERRTIVLADGSVRSYLALPPDYHDFGGPIRPRILGPAPQFFRDGHELFPPMGPMSPDGFRGGRDGGFEWGGIGMEQRVDSMGNDRHRGVEGSMKRRYWEEERKNEVVARENQSSMEYPNSGMGERSGLGAVSNGSSRQDEVRLAKNARTSKGNDHDGSAFANINVNPVALKKAFLNFAKVINENAGEKKNYLENGKHGPLWCIVCDRPSKRFPDMHALIMHAYCLHNADRHVDHLGLHKALCVLMGWNYFKPPDSSKNYQLLPAEDAAVFRDDLIIWPPTVILHNTGTGKGKDGRMEGLGNKAIDSMIRELGFGGGKSKSLYGRDGHLGFTLVKFRADQAGLREAMRMEEYFENQNRGRKGWDHVQSLLSGKDDPNNPNLVIVDKQTGVKQNIIYGHLATASDLDKVDSETKRKVLLKRGFNSV
ncbi:suppressor of gene silencing 3-like protein, partial [Drosera capensis]